MNTSTQRVRRAGDFIRQQAVFALLRVPPSSARFCAPLALRLERAAEFLMGATFARECRVLFHCDALHDIGKIVINALTLKGGVDARQSAGTW